jgi:hypothetical protein
LRLQVIVAVESGVSISNVGVSPTGTVPGFWMTVPVGAVVSTVNPRSTDGGPVFPASSVAVAVTM